MSTNHSDLVYYKLRTVQISPKDPSRPLPTRKQLSSLLPSFGTTLYWTMLCISEGEIVTGKPNTAVIVYDLQHSVTKILESSRRDKRGTLWQRKSIMAHTIDKKGPVAEFFATQIVPELGSQSESEEEISDVDETETQSTYSDAEGSTPPAKRRRTEDGGISTRTTASHTWMQAQIVRLEEELNNARNQCDRATLQLDEARRARDEATRHNDKIDAELARERAKNGQLHLELVGAHAYQLALMNDVNTLRGQLSAFEESARQAQPTVGESERVKALEQELEEAQDHAHKQMLQKSRLEQENGVVTAQLNDSRENMQKSRSEVEHLKANLASTQERLKTTERSLESMEQKFSSAHRMYESTKTKLGMYKLRYENEQTTIQELKDTLTPEVYKSLGVVYEHLGAFLSVTGLPLIDEEEHDGPKKESD